MGQELRHYWHRHVANAPRDGESFSGSKALGLSCFLSGRRTRKLWLIWKTDESSKKLAFKNQGYTSWTLQITDCGEGSQDVYAVHLCSSSLLPRFLLCRLLRAGLLSFLEGRGVSAYSALAASRLLKDWFLGTKETEANKQGQLLLCRLERALVLAKLLPQFLSLRWTLSQNCSDSCNCVTCG